MADVTVILSQKSKCTGCNALERIKDPKNGKTIFRCKLDFKINFKQVSDKVALSPRPATKCYRPTTSAQFKEAERILKRKTERTALLEPMVTEPNVSL